MSVQVLLDTSNRKGRLYCEGRTHFCAHYHVDEALLGNDFSMTHFYGL